MSTEHQQYSTENQGDRIKEYAEHHGIEIVRTYADEGKSGLNIGGREGLQRLLEDVRTRRVDFEFWPAAGSMDTEFSVPRPTPRNP